MKARLIRQREYAERVGVAFDTVTRQVQQGRCDVPPCAIRPYRWRVSDVEDWIETTSVIAARRAAQKKAAWAKQDLRLVEKRA